jgi:hypothetical protein
LGFLGIQSFELAQLADGGDDAMTAEERERTMIKSKVLFMLAVAGILGGCENMSPGQKGAVTGGALGTGIGMVAGGSFGQVVGAGLIGGAVGYIGGSAVGNR